jgi:hypothetical protein
MKFSPVVLLSVIHFRPLWAAIPAELLPDGLQDIPDETVKKIQAIKPTSSSSDSTNDDDVKGYIIRMDDIPLVAYQGGKPGLTATKPPKGQKLKPNHGKVTKYQDFLKDKHDSTLNGAGINSSKKFHDYTVCFDGFAAKLINAEVEELRGLPGVLSVTESKKLSMDTISTPDFLGLNGSSGPWWLGHKGEDVIIPHPFSGKGSIPYHAYTLRLTSAKINYLSF